MSSADMFTKGALLRSVQSDHAYACRKKTGYYRSYLVRQSINPVFNCNENIDVVESAELVSSDDAIRDEYTDVYGSDLMTLQYLFHTQAYDMLLTHNASTTTTSSSSTTRGKLNTACTELSSGSSNKIDAWQDQVRTLVKEHTSLNKLNIWPVIDKIFTCLDEAGLKKVLLSTPNNEKRETMQQIIYEKLAKQFRSLFMKLNWDPQCLPRLHGGILQYAPVSLLICYVQAIYHLFHKYHQNVLIDELNGLTMRLGIVNRFRLELFNKFLRHEQRRKAIDSAYQSLLWRPQHHMSPKIVFIRFPCARSSQRFLTIQRLLSRFAQIQILDLPTLDSNKRPLTWCYYSGPASAASSVSFESLSQNSLNNIITNWRRKVQSEHNEDVPLFIMGLGAGALLALVLAKGLLNDRRKSDTQSVGQTGAGGVGGGGGNSNYRVSQGIHAKLQSIVSGIICLGIPVIGLLGERRSSQEREYSLPVPTLMVSGAQSILGPSPEVQTWHEHLTQLLVASRHGLLGDNSHSEAQEEAVSRTTNQVRHVRVGGCDHLMRLSQRWKEIYQVTQDNVDSCMLSEIRRFVIDICNSLVKVPPPRPTWGTESSRLMPEAIQSSQQPSTPSSHHPQTPGLSTSMRGWGSSDVASPLLSSSNNMMPAPSAPPPHSHMSGASLLGRNKSEMHPPHMNSSPAAAAALVRSPFRPPMDSPHIRTPASVMTSLSVNRQGSAGVGGGVGGPYRMSGGSIRATIASPRTWYNTMQARAAETTSSSQQQQQQMESTSSSSSTQNNNEMSAYYNKPSPNYRYHPYDRQ